MTFGPALLRGFLKEIIKIGPHIQGIRNDLWGQRRKESMMATGIHFYTKQNDINREIFAWYYYK